MPVIAVTHPLVRHKVGLLREHEISTKKFRELTQELGRLLAYEATADFPLEPASVEGWAGPVAVEIGYRLRPDAVPAFLEDVSLLRGPRRRPGHRRCGRR